MNIKRKRKTNKPLVNQAYDFLKEKMINLELPPGMKLEEKDLMDMLNLGRTPIREAVKMLISVGLIVSYGANATYVKNVTLKSARDQRQFVNSLGIVAFDLASPHKDFSDIIQELESIYQKMDESIEKSDIKAFAMLNAEFHKTLAKVADNEFIDDAFERVYFFEARQGIIVSLSLGEKKGTQFLQYYQTIQKHHRGFIEYLQKRDFEKLKQIYREHMAIIQERLSSYFKGNITLVQKRT
jgi:DNA-binding GntR family transcriptional regulator